MSCAHEELQKIQAHKMESTQPEAEDEQLFLEEVPEGLKWSC